VNAAAQPHALAHCPDAADIEERYTRLMAAPPRPLRRERVEAYLGLLAERCAGSRSMTERARQVIPGGVQHNLAFNYPFPLVIARAEGAYLWDVDGNRYLDFLQAGGPTVLGNNYAPLRERVIEVIRECGPVTGLFHEYELKLAELVRRHLPAVEMFRMLGSGTEGVMAAIRVARVYTGKKRVIKAGGAYHGWSDPMVFGLHVPGTGAMEAAGIPAGALKETQEFPPNDLDALRGLLRKNQERGGTAAVILEPLGPESGTRPVRPGFNQGVRALCDEFEALLIFDEVVTGFRVGLGGAQGYFGVRPDLTVFGKCIAGGYPAAGGVGGRREIMEHLAAGIDGTGERAYVGGTLSANPLSCAAGYHALLEMERTDAPAKAARAGDRLSRGLNALIEQRGLPFVAYNYGSIVHLQTAGVLLLNLMDPRALAEVKQRKRMLEEMSAALTAEGVVTVAGSRLYTSLADTDAVIDDALDRLARVFDSV
jgi:glutamate-1-semialdehyde 2,1-aminomutase